MKVVHVLGPRSASVGLIILITVAALGLVIVSESGSLSVKILAIALEGQTNDLNYTGISPAGISLNWTESRDPMFVRYEIREYPDSPDGPFQTIDITSRTTTSYYSIGLVPHGIYWWQVYYDQRVPESSNIIQVTQPSSALLKTSMLGPNSVGLTWDNKAAYGGLVSFYSYQVMESVAGGANSSVQSITDVNKRAYNVSNLNPVTTYSFYVNTTDWCETCSGPSFSSSVSNIISINTPSLLTASATAQPRIIDVGQSVSFSCEGAGGAVPYNGYFWAFGDGVTALGSQQSHTYIASGTMTAVCTITDALGINSTNATSIQVNADPRVILLGAQPPTVDVGQPVNITATVTGGSGNYHYLWNNLPLGCSGRDAPSITCEPASRGIYQVTVEVTDSTGETATRTVVLSVGPQRVSGIIPDRELVIVIGSLGSAVLVTAIAAILTLRRKTWRRS